VRILKCDSVTFIDMLQIYVFFKTLSPFKCAMLQKNCNLNCLNCSMTQFYLVVSIRTFYLLCFFPVCRLSDLCKLARNLTNEFGSARTQKLFHTETKPNLC
jgi:hypothetical protein